MQKTVFLAGVFLLCACVVMLQIIETRILSVIAYYHLAFFAISMAMFGMTAGSLIVHFNQQIFAPVRLFDNLRWIAALFGLSVALSTILLISTVIIEPRVGIILSAVLWLKLIAVLVPPYILAGMGISLALTRSPWPAGLVYGSDLAGAAFGCLGSLALLSLVDGISAMLMVGALGAAAGSAFGLSAGEARGDRVSLPRWLGPRSPLVIAGGLAALALGNAAIHPNGLRLPFVKGQIEDVQNILLLRWNAYSRIRAGVTVHRSPAMWGPSPMTPMTEIDQRLLSIDGEAGTYMYRFSGDLAELEFLRYDITNLAYHIRNRGRSAVIGVGGGRDVLSAYLFGFREITAVEINPVFLELLTDRFRDFNHLADLTGVRLVHDDARSWFASSGRNAGFDLVQMSLTDTWAATGVGAFSLTENGLYTIEGWRYFLASLAPDGVFTVSRWRSPDNIDESGRLLSLAKATLLDMGVENPAAHLFLASTGDLATLVVGRAPLSPNDIAMLQAATDRLGFSTLVSPNAPAASEALGQIVAARDIAALEQLSEVFHLDLSPPTDERPFFFNQLRLTDPQAIRRAMNEGAGVNVGNLRATVTLLMIILLSLFLVVLTIIIPALPSMRQGSLRLVGVGTAYFLLIGLGFMFVEIGLIQRLSLFLGHPTYGLAVGLFGMILFTGIGSLLSDHYPITDTRRLLLWCGMLVLYLAWLPFLARLLVGLFDAEPIFLRALGALMVIAPVGLLMGFGFPTGLSLVNAVNSRPAPWFWAINGAAGVLASGAAVAVNIAFSINVSIWIGAACYLLIGVVAVALMKWSKQARPVVLAAQ